MKYIARYHVMMYTIILTQKQTKLVLFWWIQMDEYESARIHKHLNIVRYIAHTLPWIMIPRNRTKHLQYRKKITIRIYLICLIIYILFCLFVITYLLLLHIYLYVFLFLHYNMCLFCHATQFNTLNTKYINFIFVVNNLFLLFSITICLHTKNSTYIFQKNYFNVSIWYSCILCNWLQSVVLFRRILTLETFIKYAYKKAN